MKLVDKLLRQWRVSVALKYLSSGEGKVFDIGCDDSYLLNRIDNDKRLLDGCDPNLTSDCLTQKSILYKGFFPSVVEEKEHRGPYDAIFALAVFEHFTEIDLIRSSQKISEMLSNDGKLIVTIPHPFVDKILDILMFLRLIDGQSLHEHHGFDPEDLISIFSKHLRLKSKKTFQMGLNNLFIFQKLD
jgi:2-polyprenyl-3-methyl-5-hydroxy-6-metoxy-1,4-benzoquinol methylase